MSLGHHLWKTHVVFVLSSIFKDVFRLLFPKLISNSVSYLEKQMEKVRLNLIHLVEPSHFQLY